MFRALQPGDRMSHLCFGLSGGGRDGCQKQFVTSAQHTATCQPRWGCNSVFKCFCFGNRFFPPLSGFQAAHTPLRGPGDPSVGAPFQNRNHESLQDNSSGNLSPRMRQTEQDKLHPLWRARQCRCNHRQKRDLMSAVGLHTMSRNN